MFLQDKAKNKEQRFDALLLGEKIWEIIRKWLN